MTPKEKAREDFKRALIQTTRALSSQNEVEVAFGGDHAQVSGKRARIPLPARVLDPAAAAIARGLPPGAVRKQWAEIDRVNAKLSGVRIIKGTEADILEDGSLDQEPELLERLDVVVASVHSKLAMDGPAMTRRMLKAVANPHTDVLGHCTGRLVTGGRGTRPESQFDAEKVFTACRDHGTAVEINSRPERRDPPTRLLELAMDIGCVFAIDTDSHAPGQLDFLGYGAQRALDAQLPVERIVNTWPVQTLLDWTTS